ncbi:N-sulphoglucosamine sulphohydrolase-like [Anneissia japonica]|uniref:N-sulphoglucosamine sulphohydrolase-like n=1 Tax=Anneissia japonica TaxID=1529436 RepID=UPI0014257A83|nr:N-sulphoglucosamine sulphohydrolase-like [Anneissia japonica]
MFELKTILLIAVVYLLRCEAKSGNVLLIIGDDDGFASQVYNNTAIKTPHFNKLSERSLTIKHAYTSVSSCSPSRSAILTGLPQHQNGQYGLHHSFHHFQSFDKVQSLPLMLKSSGIRTGIIGKKHIGPDTVYKFDHEWTEEEYSLLQVGRNITNMKNLVHKFITMDSGPFFLYVAFNDPHRCTGSKYGEFCEKFGNGSPEFGVIEDWKPTYYSLDDVYVPPYLPDTPATRADISAQYTTLSRLDQGIGLLLKELELTGHLNDTLVIYSADNGIPFPNAKTNLYEPGMGEPMLISSPYHTSRWGEVSDSFTSTTDIVPTILNWFGVDFPKYKIFSRNVQLSGKSMLPLLNAEPKSGWNSVYSSHDLHEVTMYYPMRVIRNQQYRLIHNLNNGAPYPIALDIMVSPTFNDTLHRTSENKTTNWFKTLHQYYYRDEWELFDVSKDPLEVKNLAKDVNYQNILNEMKKDLAKWQEATDDPWRCVPGGVLYQGTCLPLYNNRD